MITLVIDGSPAQAAGLLPGDQIYRINGRRAVGLSLESITTLLSQKEGKKIKINVIRDGNYLKKQFRLKDWYAPTGEFGI